jgi:two-component system response regulator FixJ
MAEQATIYVVDDDEAIRDGISDLVESMGLKSQVFASAEEFLQVYSASGPACLILDVRMTGMSGLELQQTLAEREIDIPVIIVTGHGDIPMAVEAMDRGAVDFIEKPFREQALWKSIKKALTIAAESANIKAKKAELKKTLALLSPKELKVMKLLVTGKIDKQIANELGVSRRTVAFHRMDILRKMEVSSVVELASLVSKMNNSF